MQSLEVSKALVLMRLTFHAFKFSCPNVRFKTQGNKKKLFRNIALRKILTTEARILAGILLESSA
jgi:hypothetical protein